MTTTIHVRVNPKLKKQAQKILKEIGLTLSSAINVYLREIVLTGQIPFELRTVNGFTHSQEQKMIQETEWALKHGKGFSSAKELFEDILGVDYDKRREKSSRRRKK